MFHEQRHIILGKILRDRSVLVQKGNRHLSENYFFEMYLLFLQRQNLP